MTYQSIGSHALIRERETRHVLGRYLRIALPVKGRLHMGGFVYEKQNGEYLIPLTRLEKVNFPLVKGEKGEISCEGFSYREGKVTPIGEEYADMLLALLDRIERQETDIRSLKKALETHRMDEHAPTLF